MGLKELLEKLGLRKPKRIIKTPKFNAAEISDLIQGLENDPLMQCMVIERKAGNIPFSENKELIGKAVSILADNQRYGVLWHFTYSDLGMEALMQMPDEKRIEFAHNLLDEHAGGYRFAAFRLLRGIAGEKEKAKMLDIVSKPKFYRKNPVTAVRVAASLENYEVAALAFAHLSIEWGYGGIREIREFKTDTVSYEEMHEAIGKINPLYHKAVSEGNDEEAKALLIERRIIINRLIDGFDSLLRVMQHPEKAFEAVGEAMMQYEQNVSNKVKKGDYKLAVEYFIKSRNVSKILEAAKKANSVKETPEMYDASQAAFRGLKALLTDFRDADGINPEILEEAKNGLKETFRPYWAYSHSPDMAIEAAAMTGDWSGLKGNFCDELNHNSNPTPYVYRALKSNGLINDDEVIKLAEDFLEKELERETSIFNPPRIRKAIDMASLTEGAVLDSELLQRAISAAGPRGDESKAGMEYMREKGMMTPGAEKVYGMMMEGRL